MIRTEHLSKPWPVIAFTAGSARLFAAVVVGALLSGCATLPAPKSGADEPTTAVMQGVMERKNRIVHLPSPATNGPRPDLLLLHGATEDPTEMMEIFRQSRGKFDVYLYSYNYHERVKKLAVDLVREVQRLQTSGQVTGNLTVVTYSYSAIVFRTAVIQGESPATFAGATLVQLVPTAGGSRRALGMGIPIIGALASLASKPSAAQNPFGRFARSLWEGNGNRKFYEVIQPARMHSLVVEGDSHSLGDHKNAKLQRRYQNGVGPNVVTIPKTTGVTHEYFPTHPVALAYLRRLMESLPDEPRVAGVAAGNHPAPEWTFIGGGDIPDRSVPDFATDDSSTTEALR